ncbi:MAG: starch-binding protein [Ruminococcus sp.]|nr:starch-binding protein [Ruminococcus sp.]
MKSKLFSRAIAILLCLMTLMSIMSMSFTASAAYADDFDGTYEDLNCAEDDCDCLEPQNNRFKVVSPVSTTGQSTTYKDIVLTGAYHEVQDYYEGLGQTDGMPIIPPTTLKVEKFLRYTPYAEDEVIATIEATGRTINTYQVAVNAIMAGCSAEHLPLCIAYVKAMDDEGYMSSIIDSNLTPMAFANGPVARQVGVDNTQGMTTEEVNIALGRFIEFALINLAGVSQQRDSAFGNVQPLVFSENDQACLDAGWEPHNVVAGYDLNDSTFTATTFSMWGNNLTPATDLPEEVMKVLAWDITEKNLGGLGSASSEDYKNTHRTVFITEPVAKVLGTRYKTKDLLEDALIETARRPMWMRAYAYYYANTGGALTSGKSLKEVYDQLVATESEGAAVTSSPAWMSGITNPTVETGATMYKGNTDFIVTGDSSRNKTQVMPGGKSVTVKVELPDAWDTLLTSMNYQAVDTFNLTDDDNVVTPVQNIPSVLTNSTYRILDPSTGSTYLTRENRVYFDASTNTLHYWAKGATAADSIVLDPVTDADFIEYLEACGANSSLRVYNGKLRTVTIRFSSNASVMDKNIVNLTSEAFDGVTLTIHANNTSNSNTAGGVANDGSTILMSSSVTSFTPSFDEGATIVMGESTTAGFVTLNDDGTVTIDNTVPSGSKAIIGTANDDGTYRTFTFVMNSDGTYTITYNNANTLSLTTSTIYLKGSFNDWEATDAFLKTDVDGVYAVTKELAAGTYTFKIDANGTWYGNAGTFTDSADRWTMETTAGDCTINATGGKYVFKFDTSTKKLTVSFDLSDAEIAPATKTVYVGVVEHITDFIPTLHYWNNSTGLAGDATLLATGKTDEYSVGSAYWSGDKQTFNIYKTEIPATATEMKTFRQSSNDRWAEESVAYVDGQILLVFEWSNLYHNVSATYVEQEPTEPPATEPVTTVPVVTDPPATEPATTAPVVTDPPATEPATTAPTHKTVYVGVIEYIKDFVPTLHYWNSSGLAGDTDLVATDETAQYALGSSYWSNAKQNFKVYKTEIPVEATTMKTWDKGSNGKWASEQVTYAEDQILLLFEWGGTYHNVTGAYTAVETPTESVTSTTATPTDPEYTTIYFTNNNFWGSVYCYSWVDGGDVTSSWPGTKMTYHSTNEYGQDIYSISVPSDVDYVIFNGGSNQPQTVDIPGPFVENTGYYLKEDSSGKWTVDTYTMKTEEETTTTTQAVTTTAKATTAPPVVTDPPVTDPATTAPVVTDPPATEPATTAPVVTDPPATEPATTTPVVTDPPATEPAAKRYAVVYLNADRKYLGVEQVEEGKPAVNAPTPTMEADAQFTYTFVGWDADLTEIKSNVITVARYDVTVNEYTVTFKAMDGAVIDEQQVAYGSAATAPEAPEVEGYTFKEWDFSFEEITGDLTVTAIYTKKATEVKPVTAGTVKIEIVGGSGFTISVDDGPQRPQGTSYYNRQMPINAYVTVVAQSLADNEFVGWVNVADGKILSTELTYSFYASGSDTIKAMFKTPIDDAQLVTFLYDKGNTIWDQQYYSATDTIALPDGPMHAGFDFVEWNMTAQEIAEKIAAGEDVTVTPVWAKQIVYVAITVEGGKITVNGGMKDGKYLANSKTTVVADAAEPGQKFAYWAAVDAKGNVVSIKSYATEFSFYPAADTILKAVFVAEDEEIEYSVLANVDTFNIADPYGQVSISWYVPTEEMGVKFISAGLISVQNTIYDESKFYTGSGQSGMYDREVDKVNAIGTYTWTGPFFDDQIHFVKAWAKYQTADGEILTVYSDMYTVDRVND